MSALAAIVRQQARCERDELTRPNRLREDARARRAERKGTRLTPEMVARWRAGETAASLAGEAGVTANTMGRWLRSAGLRRR